MSSETLFWSDDPDLLADIEPLMSARELTLLMQSLIDKGWCVVDPAQPNNGLLDRLRQEVMERRLSGDLRAANIGRGGSSVLNPLVRRDRIHWLDGDSEAQREFQGALEAIRLVLNRSLMLGLTRVESHFANYEPGDFYQRHRDSFHGRASRIVSMVLYLNETWPEQSGGALRLYNDQEQPVADVEPLWGRMVWFLSEEIPHEVLPATLPRFSLASWYRCDQGPM